MDTKIKRVGDRDVLLNVLCHVLRHTSAVGIPASCSLIIPIICASVKRLFRIRLLLKRLGRLYIKGKRPVSPTLLASLPS